MKHIGLLIVLLISGCTSLHDNATQTLKTNVKQRQPSVPPGLLGHPLGTSLTIEGVAGQTKGGIRVLIETVNGNQCDSEVFIHVNGIYVTDKIRCKIEGYETGEMVGVPPALKLLDPNENYRLQQSQWQFWHYFVPISIEYPEELKNQLTTKDKS